MKKMVRRFETVPLAEVLKNVLKVRDAEGLKKVVAARNDERVKNTTKDEPYSVATIVSSSFRPRR